MLVNAPCSGTSLHCKTYLFSFSVLDIKKQRDKNYQKSIFMFFFPFRGLRLQSGEFQYAKHIVSIG